MSLSCSSAGRASWGNPHTVRWMGVSPGPGAGATSNSRIRVSPTASRRPERRLRYRPDATRRARIVVTGAKRHPESHRLVTQRQGFVRHSHSPHTPASRPSRDGGSPRVVTTPSRRRLCWLRVQTEAIDAVCRRSNAPRFVRVARPSERLVHDHRPALHHPIQSRARLCPHRALSKYSLNSRWSEIRRGPRFGHRKARRSSSANTRSDPFDSRTGLRVTPAIDLRVT